MSKNKNDTKVNTEETLPNSIPEIENMELRLRSKKMNIHLDGETKKIKDIRCKACGTKLRVKPEDFMKVGVPPKMFECPKSDCEVLNKVIVSYDTPPEEYGEAEIIIKMKGFAWESLHPGQLSPKHIKKWLEAENEKIVINKSNILRREEQVQVRALNLILNPKK